MKTEIINYDIDGKDFLGYAAFPDGDNFPAVIIAHTWSGRDQFVDEKAEKLAENGYLGFALDMYGDGIVGETNEENAARMQPLLDDRKELSKRVKAVAGPEEPINEQIKAKILAMHGMKDPMVGEDQMQSFYKEMSEKDVDWQLHIYGDSMHSFTNPEANNPDFGTVYSKEADRRSWMLLMDFLEEVFS